jgi:hypothetical protein
MLHLFSYANRGFVKPFSLCLLKISLLKNKKIIQEEDKHERKKSKAKLSKGTHDFSVNHSSAGINSCCNSMLCADYLNFTLHRVQLLCADTDLPYSLL